MNTNINKFIAVTSTFVLTLATMIGIPIKAYVKHIHDDLDKTCIDAKPTIWTPIMSKTYARGYIALHYPTWGNSEWKALLKLWSKESRWSHTADNPHSTAYGIAQVLNTKPGTPAPLQIEKGLAYIKHRYKKPSIAWAHWRKHYWY